MEIGTQMISSKELWVSRDDRIVSFSLESGYEHMVFCNYDHFVSYIQSMIDIGYRFK